MSPGGIPEADAIASDLRLGYQVNRKRNNKAWGIEGVFVKVRVRRENKR